MAQILIFAIGYAIGGFSALLVVGLTLASRKARMRRPTLEVMRYDTERSGL
jgi:1,4-dihydroxy-2-naphthoyl-CoA synthase